MRSDLRRGRQLRQLRLRFIGWAAVALAVAASAPAAASAVAAASTAPAAALTPPSPMLLDASRAGRSVRVYGATGAVPRPTMKLRYLRLSPPSSAAAECCVRATTAPRPAPELQTRLDGSDAPSSAADGRLSGRRGLPFIGVGFAGAAPAIVRESAHALLLQGRRGQPDVRLLHCVSSETFHLRLLDAATSAERLRYALPLSAPPRKRKT